MCAEALRSLGFVALMSACGSSDASAPQPSSVASPVAASSSASAEGSTDAPSAELAAAPSSGGLVIKLATVHVAGSMTEAVIARTLRKNFGSIRRCHEADAASHAFGTVDLELIIEEDGTVRKPPQAHGLEEGFDRCVSDALAQLTFPKHRDGPVAVRTKVRLSAETM